MIFLHRVKCLNGSICSTDVTVTGATTPGQSEPRSNGNEGVLYNPKSSKTGASTSNSLVSWTRHSLREQGSYPSTEMQSACSAQAQPAE